jgi:hypothetical protein
MGKKREWREVTTKPDETIIWGVTMGLGILIIVFMVAC